MLARDLRLALDRASFMQTLGLTPDNWQASFLDCESGRALMLCTRQAGKSTVTAVLALHQALYFPGSLVLVLSPSLRQSQELYKKVIDFYLLLGHPLGEAKALTLEMTNKSRIISLPGSERTIRGFSRVDLLIIDEAARVLDDLYFSISPMLAVSGGRLVALSTPFGKRGWFFDAWESGGEIWKRFKVTADMCPRISPEFLAAEKRSLPDRIYRQEYFCEFLQTDDAVFAYDDIMGAISTEVKPLVFGLEGSKS